MNKYAPHILIVGSGLSGLSAALEIEKLGGSCTIIEETERIGGRIKTDHIGGFTLDHGFQVLLTSYPEVKRLNLLPPLNLKGFSSGAICHKDNKYHSIINPIRHPIKFLTQIHTIPPSVYIDFLRLSNLLFSNSSPHSTTRSLLKKIGVSQNTYSCFLEPFFGGVFLDTTLEARAELFIHYLKLFLTGSATLPARGMEAIPKLIHSKLKRTNIIFRETVKEISDTKIQLDSGKIFKGNGTILAVQNPNLQPWLKEVGSIQSQTVKCFYFSIPKGKIKKSTFLHLGSNSPITNLCLPNHVQPTYAPYGLDLISATVVETKWQKTEHLLDHIIDTICSWFSIPRKLLTFLSSYHIKHALPLQKSPPLLEEQVQLKKFRQIFLAGEIVHPPSINGALLSGRKAATAAIHSQKE